MAKLCVCVFLQYYKSFGSLPGSHALSRTSQLSSKDVQMLTALDDACLKKKKKSCKRGNILMFFVCHFRATVALALQLYRRDSHCSSCKRQRKLRGFVCDRDELTSYCLPCGQTLGSNYPLGHSAQRHADALKAKLRSALSQGQN